MAQIVNRRDQNFSVAAIEINAGQWMQFGVYPVETLIQQIWEVKHNEAKLHTSPATLFLFPSMFFLLAAWLISLLLGLFFFNTSSDFESVPRYAGIRPYK